MVSYLVAHEVNPEECCIIYGSVISWGYSKCMYEDGNNMCYDEFVEKQIAERAHQ